MNNKAEYFLFDDDELKSKVWIENWIVWIDGGEEDCRVPWERRNGEQIMRACVVSVPASARKIYRNMLIWIPRICRFRLTTRNGTHKIHKIFGQFWNIGRPFQNITISKKIQCKSNEVRRSFEFVTTITMTVTTTTATTMATAEERWWTRSNGCEKRAKRDTNNGYNGGIDGMIKNYLLEQQPFPSETEVYELLSLIV